MVPFIKHIKILCFKCYVLFLPHLGAVSKEGEVCISILHEPGEDKFGYERAEERWLPIHTVETILLSVISMINEPNDESPANVDAAVSFQHNPCPKADLRYVKHRCRRAIIA